MKRIALVLLASLIVMPTMALCRENPADSIDFQAQLQQTAERLELSDEQLAELTPILRTQFDEARALLERHGLGEPSGSRPNRRALLALASELGALREATEREVAAILSEQQMVAYRQIQEEQRARMRARFQARAH